MPKTKNSNSKKHLCRALTFLLSALMFILPLCNTAGALETENGSALPTNIFPSLELYDPESAFEQISLSPSELLSLMIGGELISEEAEYVDRTFEHTLTYSTPVDPSRVSAVRTADGVSVVATEYTYVAENGSRIVWIPKSAVTADGTEHPLPSSAPYAITLDSSEDEITVLYYCEIVISASLADRLATLAYTDAQSAARIEGAEEYTAALSLWHAYLEALAKYRDDVIERTNYLKALDSYNQQKRKYELYLAEYDKYLGKLTEYEKYKSDYAAYVAAKSEYEKQYLASLESSQRHKDYVQNLNSIRASMSAIESMFVTPSLGRTRPLYLALQNPEILEMFEKYKDELKKYYSVSEKNITEARAAADELNAMLGEYAKAREESDAAAFRYYKNNYAAISEKLNALYAKMTAMINGGIFNHICGKVELEYGDEAAYKKWRIKNMLAHIFLVCRALDDSVTAPAMWSFYDDGGNQYNYYFSNLLDPNLIIADTNKSDPASLNWIDEPAIIPLPTAPKEPEKVSQPIPPTVVTKPVEPPFVPEPTEPTPVPEPVVPSIEDFATVRKTADIVEALREGRLHEREATGADRSVTLSYGLTRSVTDGSAEVLFYDCDGSYITSVKPTNGAYSLPDGVEKAEDEAYSYEFSAWSLSPSEYVAPPTQISEETYLYAFYNKTPKTYTVKIKLDEKTTLEQRCEYGQLPTLPSDEQMAVPPTLYTVTTFCGWEPEPRPVTEDTTYIAQYMTSQRLYRVVWTLGSGEDKIEYLPYGAMPTPKAVTKVFHGNNGADRYEMLGWDKTVGPVTSDVTYFARIRRVTLAYSDNAEDKVQLVSDSDGSKIISYTLYTSGTSCKVGELFSAAISNDIALSIEFRDRINVKLDKAAALSLFVAGVDEVSLITDAAGGMGIGFFNANGELIKTDGEQRIQMKTEGLSEGEPRLAAYYENGTHRYIPFERSGVWLVFMGAVGATYRTEPLYTLSVTTSEGGTAMAQGSKYAAGDKVDIQIFTDSEYTVKKYTLKRLSTGETAELKSLADFTMPDYDAELNIEFAVKEYTVSFIARGETVSSEKYRFGETVRLPESIPNFDENGYRYTFIGWSAHVGAVTGDAEYVARYYAVPISEAVDLAANDFGSNSGVNGNVWAMGVIIREIIIPVGIAATLALAAIIAFIIYLRMRAKQKKRRKARLAAQQSADADTRKNEKNGKSDKSDKNGKNSKNSKSGKTKGKRR